MLRSPTGVLLAAALCSLLASPTAAAVHIVEGGSGGSIQTVIEAAAPGDTLLLKGSFSGPGNVNLDAAGKDLVYLGDTVEQATLFGGGQSIFLFQSGETAATVLAGMTLTGSISAVVCSQGASPQLRDLVLRENYGSAASGFGGAALRCESSAAPLVQRCSFEDNAHLRGGAVCLLEASAPQFLDCSFSGNIAAWGGAVYLEEASPHFEGGEFRVNTVYPLTGPGGQLEGGDGGAVLALGGQSVFTHCLWEGNAALAEVGSPDGGGHGGALFLGGTAQAILGGSTLVDNGAERDGGGVFLTGTASALVDSSLLALNQPDGFFGAETGLLSIHCSDVWGDGAPGYAGTLLDATGSDGNLAVDPGFCGLLSASEPRGLHESSPCLPGNNACGLLMGRYGQACAGDIHLHEVPGEFATIQAAIDVAAAGDTVLVAAGTYAGAGNVNLNPHGKDLVILGAAGPALTIIDCQDLTRGVLIAAGETEAMKLSGFTIMRGRFSVGAGITCIGSAPTLENLILRDNHSLSDGGGLACIGASPRLTQVLIYDNHCDDDGAGAFCVGGAAPVFTAVVLRDNDAVNRGGGLFCQAASPQLLNCDLAFNSAGTGGAAIWADQGSLVNLERSIVVFGLGGGGLHTAGGALIQPSCCDVFGNAGGDWGGDAVDPEGADGNLSADPLYCAPLSRDFGLEAESPCAAANNTCGVDLGSEGVSCDGIHHLITGRVLLANGDPVRDVAVYGTFYEAHTDAEGRYAILVPDLWTGSILPHSPHYTFEPSQRNYVAVSADFLDQDFLAQRSQLLRVPADYPDIQTALNASQDGDTVLVAPGTYRGGGNKRLDFGGRAVVLIGQAGAAETIIDCEQAGRALNFEHGEGPDAVVDGFTLRAGHVWYEWESTSGGGIRVSGASPTLRNLIIEDCRAKGAGGGIALAASAALIQDVLLQNNRAYGEASGNGGGLAIFGGSPTLSRLLLHHNSAAEAGGAIYLSGSTALISESTLSDNTGVRGGALGLAYSALPSLEHLLVTFNAADSGGALHAADASSSPLWTCSDIFGNGAQAFAGYAEAPGGDNFTADPLYCNPVGLAYSLAEQSPCLPENNDCGVQVGAMAVGCTLTGTETPLPGFYLARNHPNPFNPSTRIRFGLPAPAVVSLRIFDILGREVAAPLRQAALPAGEHGLVWRGRDAAGRPLPSGVYLYRLEALGESATRSMLLVK